MTSEARKAVLNTEDSLLESQEISLTSQAAKPSALSADVDVAVGGDGDPESDYLLTGDVPDIDSLEVSQVWSRRFDAVTADGGEPALGGDPRRARRAIRELEERYRDVFEHAEVGSQPGKAEVRS